MSRGKCHLYIPLVVYIGHGFPKLSLFYSILTEKFAESDADTLLHTISLGIRTIVLSLYT